MFNPSIDLIHLLITLEEQAHVPIDDFGLALRRLSQADSLPGLNLEREFDPGKRNHNGMHDLNHTIRVAFWVLYLVEISNRLGYLIDDQSALAALYAAVIHDLSRVDDFPGGQHGRDAAEKYRPVLQTHLTADQSARCLEAVECHGYSDEPLMPDPVWMLLKDADALDRARLAPPGIFIGCDPSRLRLPVITENTPVLEACLKMSMVLLRLMNEQKTGRGMFRSSANRMAALLLRDSEKMGPDNAQAVRLITDRVLYE